MFIVSWINHQGLIQAQADIIFQGKRPDVELYSKENSKFRILKQITEERFIFFCTILKRKFMAAYETDLSFLLDEWYLPSADLAAIFNRMGYPIVTQVKVVRKIFNLQDVLETCNVELYAAAEAIQRLPR